MTICCDRIQTPAYPTPRLSDRVAILIPAYNEARHLPSVIAACRHIEPALILVADDASTDDTPRVLDAEAQAAGAPLVWVRAHSNLGKQGVVRLALSALAAAKLPLDAVALIDGDGQHDPAELPRLCRLITDGGYDAVLGERQTTRMPAHRQLSNAAVNVGYWIIGGVDFRDVQSGLRIYSAELSRVLADRLPEAGGYGLEHSSLALLAEYGGERGRPVRLAAATISCAYGEAESAMRPSQMLRLGLETLVQAWRIRMAAAVAPMGAA